MIFLDWKKNWGKTTEKIKFIIKSKFNRITKLSKNFTHI